ncbi:MAG TPA: transcriptional regulator, partial [Bacteroidia bacterium]|nr:transcriptional regulator [Bacteroidia bacterium]
MQLSEPKQQFINAWGTMASNWGISRSMAQVHAILLSSSVPLNTNQIMDELQISRGSANTNLRELMDWELIWKIHKSGERLEYFEAEKDPWKIFKYIARAKKRKEIDPLLV